MEPTSGIEPLTCELRIIDRSYGCNSETCRSKRLYQISARTEGSSDDVDIVESERNGLKASFCALDRTIVRLNASASAFCEERSKSLLHSFPIAPLLMLTLPAIGVSRSQSQGRRQVRQNFPLLLRLPELLTPEAEQLCWNALTAREFSILLPRAVRMMRVRAIFRKTSERRNHDRGP